MLRMRLLFILILIILAAILGKRLNTPEVKSNISELVAKIKEVSKAPLEEKDPKKKQEALTRGLETSLTELEDALKEMASAKSSNHPLPEEPETKNVVNRVMEKLFPGEPESPAVAAEQAIEKAQKIVAELKQTQLQITQSGETACESSPQ